MSEPESFTPPDESLLVPAIREKITGNNLTGQRLAWLFDILAADAAVQNRPELMMPLVWEGEGKVGEYVPTLLLVVQKIQPEQSEDELTTEQPDAIIEVPGESV